MTIENSDQSAPKSAEPTETSLTEDQTPLDERHGNPLSSQIMKPFTAAKKLGVYLPATPEAFRESPLTRAEFANLSENPPEWLQELRRTGPHPRPEVARKLGVTISGLARGGVEDALTTAQIGELLEEMPEWLSQERHNLAQVREEEQRVKQRDLDRTRAAEQ